MKYLVTGGAGFIGSNLVERLLNLGHTVRVLDNFATGKRENLSAFQSRFELLEGDLRSYHIVREAVEGVDAIFHEGALPSVPRSLRDPITSNDVNVVGTLNVLDAAKDAGVRRVVFASSSSIYGDNPVLPKVEDMSPMPLSPYAVSKLAGEKYCTVFSRVYGLHTVCLRYFNVFGPRQDPTSQYSAVIPKFITAALRNESPTIFGDGTQSRDFTFIENVVNANLLAVNADCPPGTVVNIACNERTSLLQLVSLLERTLSRKVVPIFESTRQGDVKDSLASIDRARTFLGYEPTVMFEDGIRITVQWFLEHWNKKIRRR